jgi:hypothetical protein
VQYTDVYGLIPRLARKLAVRPELTKLAEHIEPDFIAETHLGGQGQPISVAAAEGLLRERDIRAGDVRQTDTGGERGA